MKSRLERLEEARRAADLPDLPRYNTEYFRAFMDDEPLPDGPRTEFRIWCEANPSGDDTDGQAEGEQADVIS